MDLQEISIFVIQASLTGLALTYCIAMILVGGEPTVYVPVMTGLTGFWFPINFNPHQYQYNP